MTVIHPNSISGIASVTSHSNSLYFYESDQSTKLTINAHVNGDVTATNGTFSGDLTVGGTLSYDDVTNIDSVGIITARSGLNVTGGSVGIGTTNPSETLTLNHANGASIGLEYAGSEHGTLSVNSAAMYARAGSGKHLILGGNATESLRLKSDGKAYFTGNLGLGGQTSPASSIHINNFGNDGYELKLTGNALQFNRSSNSYIDQLHNSGSILFRMTSSHTEAMRITSDGKIGIGGLTNPGALLSIPAGESNTPRLAIESAVDDNDFTITQYEDGNGTYTMLGQNVKLNSGGNNTILDSAHRTAGILLDARNHGSIVFLTGGTNALGENLKIDDDGRVLVGPGAIATPKCGHAGIDIPNNDWSIIMGGSDGNGNRANNANKDGRFAGAHYVNAEEPVGIIRYVSGASENTIYMGGGSSLINAATQLSFYTAANTTTTGGYERLRITSNGMVRVTDSASLSFGNNDDMRIFHDGGSANYIDVYNKDLYIRCNRDSGITGGDIVLQPKSGENSAIFRDNGAVELYYDNAKKIETKSDGIIVEGGIYLDGSGGTASANKLDDYEEGTWTPVMNKSGVTGTAGTPSTGVGYYRKVGKLLWISFYWYKGSGSFGNNAHPWYVSGLPFLLAHQSGSAYQFIPGGYNHLNGTNYQNQTTRWQSNSINGSATLTMYGPNSSTNWTSGYLEFSASGCLMVP